MCCESSPRVAEQSVGRRNDALGREGNSTLPTTDANERYEHTRALSH